MQVWLYMIIVFGHFSEHVIQIYQIYGMGWIPKEAGGILGLWLPGLAESEVLHFAYNSFQLACLLLLLVGFTGSVRTWWKIAIMAQSWHFFEPLLFVASPVADRHVSLWCIPADKHRSTSTAAAAWRAPLCL